MTAQPSPDPPEIVTLAQAWRNRTEHVDRALAKGGRLTCRAALISLGATKDRIDLYYKLVAGPESIDEDDTHSHKVARYTLETVASMAEIAVEDEGGEHDWGRMTVDDLLAWEVVNEQLPDGPDGQPDSTYWGSAGTRHGWAICAGGVSPTDLYRSGAAIRFEELALMAALRAIRIPALAPGEVFEPPIGVFLQPVQEPFRLPGGQWWAKERRLVGDPPVGDPPVERPRP